ncbi:unnamed protein product [Mycena citricolor]|uniref:Uncharacterized protein n=1 Tax=Mycena citricolor TaxID=2018698 RepID=A0AAD2HN66_9AGAR|nr:unnamed protein product [Mycena citricolor]
MNRVMYGGPELYADKRASRSQRPQTPPAHAFKDHVCYSTSSSNFGARASVVKYIHAVTCNHSPETLHTCFYPQKTRYDHRGQTQFDAGLM